MKIRIYDRNAEQTKEFDVSEINIMADDDRDLYTIFCKPNGSIEINSSIIAKHGGVMLDTALLVSPESRNIITVKREEYKP